MDNQKPFRPIGGRFQKRIEHNINDKIIHSEVRIVGDNIETKVCSLREALALADSFNLDLVEINGNINPPICKIVDYSKFLYEKKKHDKDKKQNHAAEIKEIRLGPNIQDHDVNFKSKHATNFLKQGHKVKITMKFKGREMAFRQNGEIVMLKFITLLEEVGKPEFMPKFEGKQLYVTLTPK